MNTDIKLQRCTTPYKDYLLKDLVQPKFAKGYLEAALQDFDKDGDIETLLLSMKDVAEAQCGIEHLVNYTNLSPTTLTYLLNAKHTLQMDRVLDILSEFFADKKLELVEVELTAGLTQFLLKSP